MSALTPRSSICAKVDPALKTFQFTHPCRSFFSYCPPWVHTKPTRPIQPNRAYIVSVWGCLLSSTAKNAVSLDRARYEYIQVDEFTVPTDSSFRWPFRARSEEH